MKSGVREVGGFCALNGHQLDELWKLLKGSEGVSSLRRLLDGCSTTVEMQGRSTTTNLASLAAVIDAIADRVPQGEQNEDRAEERSLTSVLADDTLRLILRCLSTRDLLSSVALVCHRWRRLSRSIGVMVYELLPSPLRSSTRPWMRMHEKKLLQLAITHASTLERIHLHGLKRVTGAGVSGLCQRLSKLRDLSVISFPDFRTMDLEFMASKLPPHLNSLDLHIDRDLEWPYIMNDNILADIYQRCPRLRKLDIDMYSEITPNGLDGLLQACPSLISLNLRSSLLGWPEVAKVLESCKSLRHFSLLSARLLSTSESDDGESLDNRGRAIKQYGREGFFVSGVEMPQHLASLRLYSAPGRSVRFELPPMLGLLRSNGHQLQQLHAQGAFNTSWQTISVWCPNLKLLDLTHPKGNIFILTGVEEVVLCGLIQLLKKLEYIGLPSAKDRILTELGRFCPKLREIRVLDTHIRNPAVTNEGVAAVAEGCPDLRVLSLSGCHNVTISSARAIAFHCRELQVLVLNQCDQITDDAVAKLLPRLSSSLLFLDLAGCQITASTLEAIQQYAKVTTLRVVSIVKTLWQQSHTLISEIHKLNPRLRIIRDNVPTWHGFYHGPALY